MLTMEPHYEMGPEATEIVFLVDCSGSMKGVGIDGASQALQMFLISLPRSCCFNIVRFGSTHVPLFAGASQPYTEQTLEQALQLADDLKADLGGTELLPPLTEILRGNVATGRARQLFVLTDGQVSNTDQVISLLRQNAQNTRVFAVGIGDAVSRHLVCCLLSPLLVSQSA
jgi:uncharacterized protein with von Willebrand factor type A (vWA) domain